MKAYFKGVTAGLTALLAVSSGAAAQEISTSLPLTSIGERVNWTVGDQNLNLDVPVENRVRLELYSPGVDPTDYRSATYYGDEQYGAGQQVSTTFTLIDAAGKVVLTRTFQAGAHHWATLIDQVLPAGRYQLRAVTTGNGKNTFAVRLAGVSAGVSAEQLNVNVHAQAWTPALTVTTDGAGYALTMYDGDGPTELEARVRDAQGRTYPVPTGSNLKENVLPLPPQAGTYTIELRQPPGAKQYSNSVGFRLSRDAQSRAIDLVRVDQTGRLNVNAQLVLPGSIALTDLNVTVGDQAVHVNGSVQLTVTPGEYTVNAPTIPGTDVTVTPPQATVPRNGAANVQVQVRPQVALSLQASKPQVCMGDTVTFTARATTAYAGDLPLDLSLLADQLQIEGGLTNLKGTLSAGRPGELKITGTPTRPGLLSVTAKLAPWNQERTAQVQVLASPTSLQLTRDALPDSPVGETVTVALRVKNTAGQAAAFTLSDRVPPQLQALDPVEFSGTLAAGETRELTYRARVAQPGTADLLATLNSEGCQVPQVVGGQFTVSETAPEVAPAPDVQRSSQVSLPFDAPPAQSLVIAHRVPDGATYVPGSSRLNGQPVPDPKVGPSGTLYWTVPGNTKADQHGNLTYALDHEGALGALGTPGLVANLRGERTETVQGAVDLKDLGAARAATVTDTRTENSGNVKLPLDQALVRVRDRIGVTVEAPAEERHTLTVNGQAVSEDLIGQTTDDGIRGVRRLTFVGVPLKIGANVIRYGADSITVYRVGPTATVEMTPVSLIADGSTPIRVKLRALDQEGKLADPGTLTIRTNLEVRNADTNPSQAGHQIALVGGEGVLEIAPQSAPTVLNLEVLLGDKVNPYTFNVTPDDNRVGVGVLSATVGLNSEFSVQDNVTWQGRASYEGPLGGGKLYVAADKDGLPTNRDTLKRYSVTGDASTESVPLQGLDPVAFTYDHPDFRVQYRQTALPIEVLPVGEQLTALTGYSKSNPQVSGFVAAVPRDRISEERVTPEGTRLVRLSRGNIVLGSETLELVTLEAGSGKQLTRVTLVRNVDYQLDPNTGIVTLARALDRLDAQLNEQVIFASYRIGSGLDNRELAYGAQVQYKTANYSVGVAAVSLDQRVTFGVRARYNDGTTRADGLLAYSGGTQLSADASTKLGDDTITARIRYQDEGYAGLAPFGVGLTAGATYDARIGQNLRALVDGEYHASPTTSGGSVTARAEAKLSVFSVGAGLKAGFGDVAGLSAIGSVGYHQAPLDVDLVHAHPLSGAQAPETTITTRYRVNNQVSLGFTDKLTWGVGHAAALTLDSLIGNVNYAVAYELPNASGQGNRARFGVTTTLPLSDRLSAGLRGSAAYSLTTGTGEVGAGMDLNYKTDTVTATIGTDATYNDRGFGVVVRTGITGQVTPQLSLTADALAEFGAGKNGQRAALGYAYRGQTFNSLGSVRYTSGTLSGGNPELSSNLSAEYRQPGWALRGYADTRTLLNDRSSFTAQAGLSGTAYLTDRIGVGAWGHVIAQPATGTTEYGYGLEGSFRALPGTWLTLGYNPHGFSGIGTAYTRQGAYLRLDMTLDETLGGQKN